MNIYLVEYILSLNEKEDGSGKHNHIGFDLSCSGSFWPSIYEKRSEEQAYSAQ
jgi:hypothetical protein